MAERWIERGIEPVPYESANRILFEISYDGTEYRGWQIQPNAPSVQDVTQRALSILYGGLPIHLIGSSRTDAGVHALGFAASFLVPNRPWIPMERLQEILNRRLPPAVRIRSWREVPLPFHTRYDAVGKAYTYVINLGQETPFSGRFSWLGRRPIDVERMRAGARQLIGTHDYSSFVVERSMIEDAVRTIYSIDVRQFGQYLCITYKGDGFLYKMIRCLTGMLEAVGTGVLDPSAAGRILAAKDRSLAPETAPAHGLFLMKVFFDESEIAAYELGGVPFFD